MNRAEAITALGDRNHLLWGLSQEEKKHYSEALDMAISALSDYDKIQKISLDLAFENDELINELDSIKNGTSLSADGDCISRQAVIDLVSKFIVEIISEGGRDLNAHTNDVLRQIVRNISSDRVLPSVENKSRWIPVSENPKEYDRYLTYHKDGKMHVGTWGLFGWNYGHYVEDVIAWMPLPEPYKAER